jgi:hypothetical protein
MERVSVRTSRRRIRQVEPHQEVCSAFLLGKERFVRTGLVLRKQFQVATLPSPDRSMDEHARRHEGPYGTSTCNP